MIVELSKATVNGIGKLSGGLGIGTSVLAFFEVNAIGIGALSAFLTFLVYALFSALNHFKDNESKQNKERLDKLEIDRKNDIECLMGEIKKLNSDKQRSLTNDN